MILFLFILSCIICHAVGGSTLALSCGITTDNLSLCFCYPFFHASWLHLIINALSLIIMLPPISRLYSRKYSTGSASGPTVQRSYSAAVLPLTAQRSYLLQRSGLTCLLSASYIAAVIAALFCATNTPTVGCSGMVFFLLGVLIVLNPTKKQLKAYLWVAVAVLLQIYFGKSNTALHLVAFAEGAIFTIIKEFMQHYQSGNLSIYQYNDIPIIQLNDDR